MAAPNPTFEDPANPTLGELVDAFEAAPEAYSSKISFFSLLKPGLRQVGRPLGPSRDMPLDEDEIWRECAERLGGPGEIIVRLRTKGGGPGQVTVLVDLTEALWRSYAPSVSPAPGSAAPNPARSQPAPAQPSPQQASPQWQQPSLQPQQHYQTDAMGLLLTALNNQQSQMMEMIRESGKARIDPAVEVLKGQVERLSKQLDDALRAPASKEKEERKEWLELATAAATKDGLPQAAMSLLAGPLDKFADAFAKTAEQRGEVEKINAEARLLEAATKAEAAGVVPVGAPTNGATAPPPPSTMPPAAAPKATQ